MRKGSRSPRPSVRASTQARRGRMQELWRRGHTVEQIAKIVNRSEYTVRQALRFMPLPGDEE